MYKAQKLMEKGKKKKTLTSLRPHTSLFIPMPLTAHSQYGSQKEKVFSPRGDSPNIKYIMWYNHVRYWDDKTGLTLGRGTQTISILKQ